MAKKLVLERENDLVGHKMMIYVVNGADKTMESTRKVTVKFFKKSLGFTDDEIIFVELSDFYYRSLYGISHHGYSLEDLPELKFSHETQCAMNKFARSFYGDNQHGLAKQVLNIAICE